MFISCCPIRALLSREFFDDDDDEEEEEVPASEEGFFFSKAICNWSLFEKYQTKFFDLVSKRMAPLMWHISDMFFCRINFWSCVVSSLNLSFSFTKKIFFLITVMIRLPRSKVE